MAKLGLIRVDSAEPVPRRKQSLQLYKSKGAINTVVASVSKMKEVDYGSSPQKTLIAAYMTVKEKEKMSNKVPVKSK